MRLIIGEKYTVISQIWSSGNPLVAKELSQEVGRPKFKIKVPCVFTGY